MLKALSGAVALSLSVATSALAAGPPEADAVVERFFGALRAGDVTKAYQDVGRGTLMEQKRAEFQNAMNQQSGIIQLYGKFLEWELMSEKTWSPSYISRNYLVKAERGPIFYNIHLYGSPTGWVMVNFYFTDTPKNVPDN